MNIPEHFDFINSNLIYKWRKEIEQTDRCNVMTKPQKEKTAFMKQLNEKQRNLLNYFELSVINKFDYIFYDICKRLFYFGIKTGMDLKDALNKE